MLSESEQYAALLTAVTRLVRDPDAPRAVAADAGAWLAGAGVAPEDAASLAGLGAHRLLVYRRHVRRTLARAVRQQIPRTAARLGDALGTWVDRFVEDEAPRSRYFRDVAFEMVAWATPRWAEDPSVPAYLGDLARHELAELEVAWGPDADVDAAVTPIELARGVRFAPSVRLRRYDHAVHRLDASLDARDVPDRTPTALLVYRDADLEVHFLDLTPLAASILERLIAGEALGPAVVAACAAAGVAVDPAVTGSTAALLGDLMERGAILGGEAC
jgi:hypothetical protein